jgi:hypothetical protein
LPVFRLVLGVERHAVGQSRAFHQLVVGVELKRGLRLHVRSGHHDLARYDLGRRHHESRRDQGDEQDAAAATNVVLVLHFMPHRHEAPAQERCLHQLVVERQRNEIVEQPRVPDELVAHHVQTIADRHQGVDEALPPCKDVTHLES